MTALTTFYGVTLDCPDPSRLADFYRQLTGMEISYSSEEFAGLSGDGPTVTNHTGRCAASCAPADSASPA